MAADGRAFWRSDWFFAVAVATCALFWWSGGAFFASLSNPLILAAIFGLLFVVILGSALSAVRHADHLAAHFGEPFGTLILTLAVTFIEVMSISAIMLHGDPNPTLVRDTLLSVIMISLNGLVGLSLLTGALRHKEQSYNLQGANAYLGLILPLAVMSVVLPDYTVTSAGPTLSTQQRFVLALFSIALYCGFLLIQTGRHRGYFTLGEEPGHEQRGAGGSTVPFHVAMLTAYLVPVVYLAEQMAHPVDYVIETLKQPTILGGVAIALLVTSPEGVSAVRAARANHLQRSINILFGSVLSSIGLTVPIMLLIVYWYGLPITLGVEHADLVVLLLTLGLSIVTFSSGRTNALQGGVHVLLFVTFLLLIVQG
ncbi:sodium/calcium exchanger membrane region [Methylocella silvestris BL2]|uniref:Sodium/calcium exchanger membrane region n=1 Tax=Methylocella silvestris (strain DSM 15510 / CIP 108128 / LMG 27833 / NCIMB 13906 / BL2) TaxID=395965 RepID=B8ERE0_METSB|nr:calcium:proton antiporter [Methylocella silvestris]ACK50324.1 sodium/calcium exchanger membrane region [Methylocella silvestris BL2]